MAKLNEDFVPEDSSSGAALDLTLAAAPLENGWLCLASRGACTQLVDTPHADELPVEALVAEEPLVRE
jgi:hypothetical protein